MQEGDVFVWLSILIKLCKLQVGGYIQHVSKEISGKNRKNYNILKSM